MNETVETIEYKDFKIKIFRDNDPNLDPRDWSNLGIMACKYKDYDLGDKQIDTSRFNSWADVKADILDRNNVVEILPLEVYEHSGLTIKVGSFDGMLPQGHARFDTSKVGFIYATEESMEKMGTERDHVKEALKQEVDVYDSFIRGEVYGYQVEDSKGVHVDTLGGFYGYNFEDNGLLNHARNSINHEIQHRKQSRFEKLKELIDNNVSLETREDIMKGYPLRA